MFCVFSFFKLNAQSYTYNYSDPCTGNLKTVVVPINGNVTVSYYGEIGSFSQNDFTNGTFESWTNNIFSQYGTNSPCSEIVGLGTTIDVTQGTALNVLGILNSLSAISDLASGSTNILGGSVTSIGSVGGKGNSNNNKKGNNSQNGSGGNTTNYNNGTTTNYNNTTTNNNQNQTNGTSNPNGGGTTTSGTNQTGTNGGNGTNSGNAGTQTPTQAGGATTQSGSNENGTTTTQPTVGEGQGGGETQTSETPINNQTTSENGSSESGSGSNGGSENIGNGNGKGKTEETTTPEPEKEEGGQTNITGGATTTVKSTPTSKEGGKPTIIASGDFVGFNFRNSDVRSGLKLTGGYTAMRWDGKRSSGILGDYTSALRGPNVTAFYAFIKPKSIVIGSATLTIGFVGNKSLYGTIAIGQMFSFKKVKSLKVLYMGTVSYGQVFRESFLGTALIGGATYDLKIGKRFDIKLMNLLVYAPYVSYYNDVVLKSPYVMLPSIGTNIKITKKFKFNINAGGAWDLKTSALNYTVTCGARMLVGQ